MTSMLILCLCCRKQGDKLRRLMTFAWPCLVTKSCVDPATKYHGHLLLSHIIAKFAIHKRIVLQVRATSTIFSHNFCDMFSQCLPDVLQVFHSLLKAHAVEARVTVRAALDILTPAMPGRMEDGNVSLLVSSFCFHKNFVISLNLFTCTVHVYPLPVLTLKFCKFFISNPLQRYVFSFFLLCATQYLFVTCVSNSIQSGLGCILIVIITVCTLANAYILSRFSSSVICW